MYYAGKSPFKVELEADRNENVNFKGFKGQCLCTIYILLYLKD